MTEHKIVNWRPKKFSVSGTLSAAIDDSLEPKIIAGQVTGYLAEVAFDVKAAYVPFDRSNRIIPRVWIDDTINHDAWSDQIVYTANDVVSYMGAVWECGSNSYPVWEDRPWKYDWYVYDAETAPTEFFYNPVDHKLYYCNTQHYTEYDGNGNLIIHWEYFTGVDFEGDFDFQDWTELPTYFYESSAIVFYSSRGIYKAKSAGKTYGTRLIVANGKLDNDTTFDTYPLNFESVDTVSVSYSFEVSGNSDLVFIGELFHNPTTTYYLGAGRSNGELSIFGDEGITIEDEFIPTARLTIDEQEITWTGDASRSNVTSVTLAAKNVYYATLEDGEIVVSSVLLDVALDQDEFKFAEATFADRPAPNVDREYTKLSHGGWHLEYRDGYTEADITAKSILFNDNLACYCGLVGAYINSGFHQEDGVTLHSEEFTVYSGAFTMYYETSTTNLFGSNRTDLTIKGLDRHPVETVTPITEEGITGNTYSYEWEDEYINVYNIPSVVYKGRLHTTNMGDMIDTPGNGTDYVQVGKFKVQNVKSTLIDIDNPAIDVHNPINWSGSSSGNPTHPVWEPFPEIQFYEAPYNQWMMSHLIDGYGIVDGEQWYDDDCTITADSLYQEGALKFSFPTPDANGIVATPFDFTTDGWTASNCTTEVVNEVRTVYTTGVYPKITNNLFDKAIRLTGSRFAIVSWSVDQEVAGVTIKIGDENVGYHSWKLTTPEGYVSGEEILSEIDLCYPDSTTIPIENMQSIISYERPLDQSEQIPGQGGIGRRSSNEKDYYRYVFPKGWGVGRIPEMIVEPDTLVANYSFKDISLKWKSEDDGGIREIIMLPHQTWVDDRTLVGDYINSYMLPLAGEIRVSSEPPLEDFHVNYKQCYPKCLVIVDGAVIAEIPAGHLFIDYQQLTNPDNTVAPNPHFFHVAYKLDDIVCYPEDSNSCVALEVNDYANWNSMVVDNCYTSFLMPGIYSFMGQTEVLWNLEPRFNYANVKLGMGYLGIGGLSHIQQGSVYGISKADAEKTLNLSSPNAAAGWSDNRVENVDKIGFFISHEWNGKSNENREAILINGKFYPINNRYITRIVTDVGTGGFDVSYCFDGFRYFRAYSLNSVITLQMYSAGDWVTFSTFSGENPSILVYQNKLYVAHTVGDRIRVSISDNLGKTFSSEEYAMLEGSFPILINNPITMKQYLYYLYATNTIKVSTSVDFGETWSEPNIVTLGVDNAPFDVCIINYAKTIFEVTFTNTDGEIKRMRSYDGIDFPLIFEGEPNQ